MSQTGVSLGVDASAALSKSGAYHRGLVPYFAALFVHYHCKVGTNTDRLVPDRDLFMVGRYALQSPGLFSPVWYRPTSALHTDPRTPQQLCLCDGRRVNH